MLSRALISFAALVSIAGAAWADPAEDAAKTAKSAADAIILTGPIGALFVLVVIGLVVACGVLGFVIKALWGTIAGRDVIIAGLQEKRASDAATSSKLIAETATAGSAAIAANTIAQADLNGRMQAVTDLVRPLGPEHQRMLSGLDRNYDRLGDIEKTLGQGCRA